MIFSSSSFQGTTSNSIEQQLQKDVEEKLEVLLVSFRHHLLCRRYFLCTLPYCVLWRLFVVVGDGSV